MRDIGNKEVMAKNLKALMDEKGVKTTELSKAIDVPYTTVRSWLRGSHSFKECVIAHWSSDLARKIQRG